MNKLDKEFKKRWIDILLSEKYGQGFNSLGHDNKVCVLGAGGIALAGSSSKGYEVLKDKEIESEFCSLNDVHKIPFEVFAGIIDEWL